MPLKALLLILFFLDDASEHPSMKHSSQLMVRLIVEGQFRQGLDLPQKQV